MDIRCLIGIHSYDFVRDDKGYLWKFCKRCDKLEKMGLAYRHDKEYLKVIGEIK
jgi:hypothetical protein